jgi:hypothetical protein
MEKLWGEWLISQGLSGHLFWHTMRLYLWNENRERERERERRRDRERGERHGEIDGELETLFF